MDFSHNLITVQANVFQFRVMINLLEFNSSESLVNYQLMRLLLNPPSITEMTLILALQYCIALAFSSNFFLQITVKRVMCLSESITKHYMLAQNLR